MAYFKEWLEQQDRYYWASSRKYAPGSIVIAGSYSGKGYNVWATAFNDLIEKHRVSYYSDIPSREGALFLSDSVELGRRWQKALKKDILYGVQLLDGKIHKTDSDYWGDALHVFSKWGLYQNLPVEKAVSGYHSGEHGYKSSIEDFMNRYWKGERDEDRGFEMPEIILGRGGKIKILGEI